MPQMHGPPECPVCKARLRGQRYCSRCGADLLRLMRMVARAHQLREQARRALCEGRYHAACALADEAQNLHYTIRGRRIARVARILDMVSVRH